MSILPGRIFTHHLISIAIAMRLLIGLIHHVDAPTVAEFIEVFTVRIMRGTQEVDIGLFHQSDILLIGSIVDITACHRVVIMTVHTTQFHVLAVDLKDLADTLYTLHAQMIVEMFKNTTLSVCQLNAERIEIRFLCRPKLRVINKVR